MRTTEEEESPLYCCSTPFVIMTEHCAFHHAREISSAETIDHIEENVRLFVKDYAIEAGLVTQGYPDADSSMLLAHYRDDKVFKERLMCLTDNVSYLRDHDLRDICRRIDMLDITAFADIKSYVDMKCDELDRILELLGQGYAKS